VQPLPQTQYRFSTVIPRLDLTNLPPDSDDEEKKDANDGKRTEEDSKSCSFLKVTNDPERIFELFPEAEGSGGRESMKQLQSY